MARTKGAKDKKPRKRAAPGNRPSDKSPIIQGVNPDLPEGYNTKMVNFILAIMPTEPLDYDDIEEMERRFLRYLKLCAEWDVKVGNQGAYLAIGIDKHQAWEWENTLKGNPARTTFIKKVRKLCAYYREGLMQDGKINPVTGIFWQKNYDGFKDQQEVVVTPNNPLGDIGDTEKIKQKYLDGSFNMLPEQIAEEAEKLPESAEGSFEKAQKGAESDFAAAPISDLSDNVSE